MTGEPVADLLVVGAGLAGLSAATRAAELGLRTVVFEASRETLHLCNSRYTGGLFHIAMDNMGGPPDWVVNNVVKAMGGAMDEALARTLAANARRTLHWLESKGVRFIKAGPDGLRRNALAPPGVRQTGLNWRGRSGDVMLRTLEAKLTEFGGKLMRAHDVTSLVMEKGVCKGVKVSVDGGEARPFMARNVLLADGGFQADPELVGKYISPAPERLLMRNARTGRGSGLKMALEAGADAVGLDAFYGHVQHRDAMHDPALWPYPVLDSLATAGLLVDGNARRFCDEGLGGVYVTNAIARLEDPLSAWVIFDDAIWKGPGQAWLLPANPFLQAAGGNIHSAGSLAELAGIIGLDAEKLQKSVEAQNAAIGGRAQFDPPRRTDPTKPWPVAKAPFYAIPLCAGVTYTMGGILTDTQARVVDRKGRVIGGLLAAGATTGGLEGGPLCGYSGGLSKSSVFGLIAAETAFKGLAKTHEERYAHEH